VTFRWINGLNADNHRIEIDNDLDFASLEENVTLVYPINTHTTVLDRYTTYYWRVWAVNASGENVSENTWQLTVVPVWGLVETWRGRVNKVAPVWYALETWSGTVEAPRETVLSVDPASFSLTSGASRTLTATLQDVDGNPVENRLITWSATAGTLSPSSGTTNNSGQVSVTYTAPSVSATTFVTVKASFAGDNEYQENEGSSVGTIYPPPPGKTSTSLSIDPSSFELVSGGSRTLTATLKDANDNPLSGETVIWGATAGTLSVTTGTTDAFGQVAVTYTAPPVTENTSVTITASFAETGSYYGSQGSSTGTIFPAPPTPTSLVIAPSSFFIGAEESFVMTTTLKDNAGNPLAGKTVNWDATAGSVDPSSATTNDRGQASTTYTAPAVENQTPVTVTASFAGDNEYSASSAGASGMVLLPEVAEELENLVKNVSETTAELDIPLENEEVLALENAS
jgi:adhesin/invasin